MAPSPLVLQTRLAEKIVKVLFYANQSVETRGKSGPAELQERLADPEVKAWYQSLSIFHPKPPR